MTKNEPIPFPNLAAAFLAGAGTTSVHVEFLRRVFGAIASDLHDAEVRSHDPSSQNPPAKAATAIDPSPGTQEPPTGRESAATPRIGADTIQTPHLPADWERVADYFEAAKREYGKASAIMGKYFENMGTASRRIAQESGGEENGAEK